MHYFWWVPQHLRWVWRREGWPCATLGMLEVIFSWPRWPRTVFPEVLGIWGKTDLGWKEKASQGWAVGETSTSCPKNSCLALICILGCTVRFSLMKIFRCYFFKRSLKYLSRNPKELAKDKTRDLDPTPPRNCPALSECMHVCKAVSSLERIQL